MNTNQVVARTIQAIEMDEDDRGDRFVPEYIALCVYKINRQRDGYSEHNKPECELSIINHVCFTHGITPSQEIYDEVYRVVSEGYDYVR